MRMASRVLRPRILLFVVASALGLVGAGAGAEVGLPPLARATAAPETVTGAAAATVSKALVAAGGRGALGSGDPTPELEVEPGQAGQQPQQRVLAAAREISGSRERLRRSHRRRGDDLESGVLGKGRTSAVPTGTNGSRTRVLLSVPKEKGKAGGGGKVGGARGLSGRKGRRRPWLEFLAAETRSKNIWKDLRKKGSLASGNLSTAISRTDLAWVALDPDFDESFAPRDNSWPLLCPAAGACPDFGACGTQVVRLPPDLLSASELQALQAQGALVDYSRTRQLDWGTVQACTIPALSSRESARPAAPLNCPRLSCAAVPDRACDNLVFDSSCSHELDDVPTKKWLSTVYLLHNVYVNRHGQPFNATRFFDRSGCASFDDFSYPVGFPVIYYDTIISLAHWSTSSFYHGIIELLPMFFVFAHLPALFKAHPIAVEVLTVGFLHEVGSLLLGPDLTKLNLRVIQGEYIFHAKTLIQPLYQFCGSPCPTLWREMRRLHLVPKDGLPMFNPDWSPRQVSQPAVPVHQAPEDWIVILVQRFGSRALTEHEHVLQLLESMFTKERVLVFSGNVDILEAKEVFNRAVLLVAVHGAAMTNMIFMPFHATVVELRPRDYSNACYHHLSDVCDLNYFLMLCDGEFETATSCNVKTIESTLQSAVPLVKSMTLTE